ncbi:MAG: endonuclease/exonuclease/phosphatase family protein [Paludibacteraceae bacterium]|nr:endonuclease/exonuclease/phosphatase family protein [Paludibacteraceae bacterium]
MKKNIFLAVIAIFTMWCLQLSAQKYVVGFYNLENLFDTIDNPLTIDEEYLPDGKLQWNTMRYNAKVGNMAYAISQMPQELAVLGVAEVENKAVMEDVAKQPCLESRNLKVIHFDSPDRRGVDVGLFYNEALFTPLRSEVHRIKTEIPDFYTRDQLVVTGMMADEEISIVVVHWPSRRGGKNTARLDAAQTTRGIIDSLHRANPYAKVIVMGDLNDDPIDESLTKVIGAKSTMEKTRPGEMFNPCYGLYKKGIGSLGYNDQWNLFDQILVNYNLLPKEKNVYDGLTYYTSKIFNRDFLQAQNGQYKGYPLRTHTSGVWTNGYSDHFPSLIWLRKG